MFKVFTEFVLFTLVIETIECGIVRSSNIGTFWHVTDLHYDPTYTEGEVAESCHGTNPDLGIFGDYQCDAPWKLINNSIYQMRLIEPNPDFIVWTGDDTPHVDNEKLSTEKVIKIIHDLTDLLMEVFPETTVYAALGNHDYHPKNQLPGNENEIYDAVADKWKLWMNDAEAEQTFRKGGYYTLVIDEGLRAVVLNTNLNYKSNDAVSGEADPGDQFAWFDEVMTAAAKNEEKVLVISHLPPGRFEKQPEAFWMYPEHNEEFLRLIRKHAGTFAGIFMAHHHTDSFRIFADEPDGNTAVASMFLAPSITPWETTYPGVIGSAANNPGIRLFKYNRENFALLDYWQYFLNLTFANDLGVAHWDKEYEAVKDYGIPDISTSSLHQLLTKFGTVNSYGDDISNASPEFRKYLIYNSVSYDVNEQCDAECHAAHVCAIKELDLDRMEKCLQSRGAIKFSSCFVVVLTALLTMAYFTK